jgi:hypothetical protein
MKEDILEQLVDDYLKSQGYFTTHNIKFKPDPRHKDYVSNQDSVPSDIDILAVHPNKRGADKVVAVTCKSWQTGINPSALIKAIETNAKLGGRIAWKSFRELKEPKWSAAYCRKIEEMTGSKKFTYWTAVTKVIGDPSVWENHKAFQAKLNGNKIAVKTVRQLLDEMHPLIGTTVEPSQVGRLLQVIKASEWSIPQALSRTK